LIDWGSLQVARVWPLWLLLITVVLLFLLWFYRRSNLFPDLRLVTATSRAKGLVDRLPIGVGVILLLLLTLAMLEPTVVRIETIVQRARDYLILVDTSRSMRHDTEVRRENFKPNFERRVGAFDEMVSDPQTIPYIARYELARESLLGFLVNRRAGDRVGLIYFNDDAHPVSALTSNIAFVTQQLDSMDKYVNWGTNIATAIDTGLSLLERYPEQNKRTLILLTDAETQYTKELEQQLARLANEKLSFYLLWITTDEKNPSDEAVSSFLDLARSLGTVITIQHLDSDNLKYALMDVDRMESYSYQEVRRRIDELTPAILQVTRILFLVWLALMATVFHPGTQKTLLGNA
jgi:Mg-chelatase subunit ChlD